jgi:hypothetical protein
MDLSPFVGNGKQKSRERLIISLTGIFFGGFIETTGNKNKKEKEQSGNTTKSVVVKTSEEDGGVKKQRYINIHPHCICLP